jgi:hypothetical protein
MTTNAASTQDPSRSARSSVTTRSIGGVIACGLASFPLGIAFSLWGFYVHRADVEWHVGYVLISTVIVTFFSLVIATFCAVCVGMPLYALVSRLSQRWRPLALVLGAVIAAVAFHELWVGGDLFENTDSVLQFALFGVWSGAAFWFGADVWQPLK